MAKPWLIIGGAAISVAVVVGSYWAGWSARGDREAARLLEEQKHYAELLEKERQRGDQLAVALEKEKQNIKTVSVEVVKEVPKVTTVYVERPGDAEKPIPPAVITWGTVRLYNRALRPDLPGTAGEFAYPPGRSDLARAPVDIPDILNNHVVNASKYAECRAQLNALIDWHEGRKKGQQEAGPEKR